MVEDSPPLAPSMVEENPSTDPSPTRPRPAFAAASSTGTPESEASPATRTKPSRRSADERLEQSLDKMYADFVKFEASRRLPHMEWNGSDFVPQRPAPQPVLQVNATIMVEAHRKFGVSWKGSRRGIYQSRRVSGIADSGCQVPLAGVDFLESIGCPKDFLVPTRHGIIWGFTYDIGYHRVRLSTP